MPKIALLINGMHLEVPKGIVLIFYPTSFIFHQHLPHMQDVQPGSSTLAVSYSRPRLRFLKGSWKINGPLLPVVTVIMES